MKKLFNHTKRPYEKWDKYDGDENYDWDAPQDDEYYGDEESDGEYYADGESDDEYYADGEPGDEYYADEESDGEYYTDGESDSEYYAEESGEIADDGYYADGESDGEYYADGEPEGEYYADEESDINTDDGYYAGNEPDADAENVYYENEEPDDGYYADNEFHGEYYADEESDDTYYMEDDYDGEEEKAGNVFTNLWEKFLDMGAMDRVITVTGVAVLILALVTGGVYLAGRTGGNGKVTELAGVGGQLDGISVIGERGLLAVADAQLARQAVADVVEDTEEQKDYNESEYANAVTVKLNMTSVMKDLKIKFTNKETGRLVANVPFAVTITKPDGKSETWTDDDMDGIIYKKNITPGTYSVLVNELTGEQYKDITVPSKAQTVEVKKDIAYEKIDVSDEVKTEAEIDVSKEDTKVNETVVESALQDTVAWVESTAIAENYTEVSKSTIPDPTTLTVAGHFMRMAQTGAGMNTVSPGDVENAAFTLSVSPATVTVGIGGTITAKATAVKYTEGQTLKYTIASANPAIATAVVDAAGNITVTGVATGTVMMTVTADYTTGASKPAAAVLTVTVPDKPVVTLDKATATVFTTATTTINATVTNATTGAALTVESSNAAVATATVTGNVVTITGVAEGDAVITVKYTENGQAAQAACTVKVKAHPKDNKTDKLKDSKGNQLYVLEGDKYREAVYADYYTAAKFFIKGDTKYTGWQTIDGHVYFFTAEGNKVTGEQVIQGAKYNFASDGSLVTGSGTMGIDVSKWNGTIDWDAVKNSGVSYVIIRCGYRGSSQGMLIEDPKFAANIKGATAAGLKVGVYFFTQATDEVEAVEEASFVLDRIKNYKISYPVFLDVESSGGRGDKIDKATRTAVCKTFCETIQRNGYTAGVYANKTWLNEKMDAGSLSAYKIWLAQYAATPTYKGRYDLWQYKSTGKVSGIQGNVDLNLSYLGY